MLPDKEIDNVKEQLYSEGANVKKIYSTAAYNNLDIYQVNTTYYSALGNNDNAYLLARAIQFFAPGIPQIYYVGMLAGENDIALMEETKNGRDINRHYYKLEEIEKEQEREVVKKLKQLMVLRNTNIAFDLNAQIEVEAGENGSFRIKRLYEGMEMTLIADLLSHKFEIINQDKVIFRVD